MSVGWLCFLCLCVCRLALWSRKVFGTPSIAQLVERRTVEVVKTSFGSLVLIQLEGDF